jgi:hypothetical protein
MMPDIDREERRKKRAPVISSIICGALTVTVLIQLLSPGWQWLPLAVGIAAATAVGVSIDPPGRPGTGHPRAGRRSGSGFSGRDRDDDDGPGGPTAHRWRMLVMASLLMPRSAGHRWLAEAESLLSEITAARRGAAIRSYMLSAPRLAAVTWARTVLRQARPGRQRPG